jgi:hypothetical protein
LPSGFYDRYSERAGASLRDKLIKIGAKVVSHGRYVTFQLAEVAVSQQIRGYLDAHRPVAGAALTSLRGAGIKMRQIARQRCALRRQSSEFQRRGTGNRRFGCRRHPSRVELVAIDDRINPTAALVGAGIRGMWVEIAGKKVRMLATGPVNEAQWDNVNKTLTFQTVPIFEQIEKKLTFFLTFGDIEGVTGEHLTPRLEAFAQVVGNCINGIEAETRRLLQARRKSVERPL